jgi:hypothetical protein
VKNQVVQELKKIKANHDEGIFTDAGRFGSIIRDVLPDDNLERIREGLRIAIEKGAYNRLKQAEANGTVRKEVSIMADILHSQRGVDTVFALEVVGFIAALFTNVPVLPIPLSNPNSGSINSGTSVSISGGSANPNKLANAGDIIPFGKYYWRVLEVRGNQALLITQKIVAQRAYDIRTNIWEKCELRTYLNSAFYNDTFNPIEQSRIFPADVWNKDYDKDREAADLIERGIVPPIKPDGYHTKDKIFLLSIEEAKYLFKDNVDRIETYNRKASWWWLRSGHYGNRAAYVDTDGTVYLSGIGVSAGSGGVRPALWLNL